MKTRFSLLLTALAVGVFFFSVVSSVQAHGVTPTTTQPASGQAVDQSPPEVVLVFPEEIAQEGNTLQVLDASAKIIAQGGGLDLNDPEHVTLRLKLPALPSGVYTVRWTIKLDDGDSANGVYNFGVGKVEIPNLIPGVAPAEADEDAEQPAYPSAYPPAQTGTSPILWLAAGLVVVVAAVAAIFVRRR
jgi:methionine-rich copper-binding protein CopC